MVKVKIVYRNYKPIHDLYASFVIEPPENVTYFIPAPKRYLRYFLPLHRRLGDVALLRSVILKAQEFFFRNRDDRADLYHFAQLISDRIPQKPYVVDFEHVTTLANFSRVDLGVIDRIVCFLSNSLCCKITPLSCAALYALKRLLGKRCKEIEDKIKVVYPALPNYCTLAGEADYTYVNRNAGRFKLLFVGNGAYKKGLYELLVAFQELERRYGNIELYVISDASERLKRGRYDSAGIKFLSPKFAHHDIIRQFYLPCDLFVLPTHSDSFGMALLYSLACGTPVLTTKQFAAPEIVEPGRNGLFIHSDQLYLEQVPLPSRETWSNFRQGMMTVEKKLVDDLVDKIEYLYLNRDMVREMGRRAVKDFEPGGKFSIDVRNRKLGEVYRSCLCQ